MNNVLAKLLLAQKKIQPIAKSEENPYYKSNYFDINALIADVKPILSELGLVVLQPPAEINGKPALRTIIADPESGESLESTLPLMENSDPQKFGAIMTYMRRFALTSFLCLQGEDDDGNTASGKKVKVSTVKEEGFEQPFQDRLPPLDPDEAFSRAEEWAGTQKPIQEGDQCPKCQKGILKIRNGRKGPFIGCGAFPKCDFTANV